jgi:hypothetical protein
MPRREHKKSKEGIIFILCNERKERFKVKDLPTMF